MEIGDKTYLRGQAYECVGSTDHITRDGHAIVLTILESQCAECGRPFQFGTMDPSQRGYLSRRCGEHRKPGVPVWPHRAKAKATRAERAAKRDAWRKAQAEAWKRFREAGIESKEAWRMAREAARSAVNKRRERPALAEHDSR
jgi:hypothetical protein